MAKTQYYTAATLDGYLATETDSLDWLFALGELGESSYPGFIAEVGALGMGSSTYEWILRHADEVARETGSSWPYPQPTWVFTTRELPLPPGTDEPGGPAAAITFVRGPVAPVHTAMREAAAGRNCWLVGGGDLVGQFHDVGLLDEVIVQIGSVTLGGGKPLLPRRILAPVLHLHDVRRVGPELVELRYTVRRD